MADHQEDTGAGPESDPQPPSRPHQPGPSVEALLEERVLLRAVLDASPSLVFVKDRHGRFVLVNAAFARFQESTQEEIIHRSEREVHGYAGEADGFLEMDRRVISTREAVRLEEHVTRPDGELRWLETTKMPLVRPSGEVQVIGFCVDITERKRAQLELERTARELEAMAVAARGDAAEKAALAEELDRKLAIIEAQHREIAALSVPILEMGDGVIGVPILGAMDEPRAAALTERLLAAIAERQVRRVVLDLSGVDAVDTLVADRLLGILRAIELLGARAIVTGIRGAVARTMVALGIDLSTITTMRTPKDAIRILETDE